MNHQIFNITSNEVVKLANNEGIKRVPNKNEITRGLKYQAPNSQGKYEGLINSQYVSLAQVKDKRTGKNLKNPIIILFSATQAEFLQAKTQYEAYLEEVYKKGQNKVNRNAYLTEKDSQILTDFYGNHEVIMSTDKSKKIKFLAPKNEKDFSIPQRIKAQNPDRIVMSIFVDEVQRELIFPEKFFISKDAPEYQTAFDKMVALQESKRKVVFKPFDNQVSITEAPSIITGRIGHIEDSFDVLTEELEEVVVVVPPKRPVKKDFTVNDVFDKAGYDLALSNYNSYKLSQQKKAEVA